MDDIRRVMWGRLERPVTVFVPWDCGHHCPFCTTKHEYEKKYPQSKLDYYFKRQKESLRRLLEYRFFDDIVFTGGEPLADLERLDELIDLVRRFDDPESHSGVSRHNVYINTSLNFPDGKEDDIFRYLCRESERKRIDGISVSLPYADVSMTNAKGYALLRRIVPKCFGKMSYTWVRINSVVKGNESAEQIRSFVRDIKRAEGASDYGIWSINFRKNYSECNQANLNDCFDPMMQTLMSMPDMEYVGGGGCLVCRNDVFWPDGDMMHRVTYHRGTELTSLRFGDLLVINDVVVKQDGEIRYDWNDGAVLSKCAMDALAKKKTHDDLEWKWKNHFFSTCVGNVPQVGRMTCRDHYSAERCG